MIFRDISPQKSKLSTIIFGAVSEVYFPLFLIPVYKADPS